MGRVHRRIVALALAAAVVPATLVACSAADDPAPRATALPSAAPIPGEPEAAPSGGSTTGSSPGGGSSDDSSSNGGSTDGSSSSGGSTNGSASNGERPSLTPTTAPKQTFAVGTRTLALRRGADRPLTTTVWVPRGDGPFPLILFSHGLGGKPSDYRELVTSWARAGFVVAAPAYPHTAASAAEFNVLDVLNQPADASYVITQTLAELGPLVDRSRVAAAGAPSPTA